MHGRLYVRHWLIESSGVALSCFSIDFFSRRITHETGRFVQRTVQVNSLFSVMDPGNVNSHGPLSPTCGTEKSIDVDLHVILMIC